MSYGIILICLGEKEELLKTRAEEEVEGFLFGVLKEQHPEHLEALNKFKDHLIESKDAMKPLKAWEINGTSSLNIVMVQI